MKKIDFKKFLIKEDSFNSNPCIMIKKTGCGYECYWSHENENLNEDQRGRYSIQVNYRSKIQEVIDSFAKLSLGYASAAMKKNDFHVKHVFDEKPFRIFVSSRKWDNGEWVALASWNDDKKCFVIAKGFYKKENNSVAIQGVEKCSGETPADIAKDLKNLLHDLKDKPDRYQTELKGLNLKTGPKR